MSKNHHIKLFISYAHEDGEYKNQFIKHLSPLKTEGLIQEWHDEEISPGEVVDDEVWKHFAESRIMVPLISPDYIASDFCYLQELNKALEEKKENKKEVVPIIIRHCSWKETAIKEIKVIPKDGKPISKWEDEDAAWVDVINAIKKIVNKIENSQCENHKNRDDKLNLKDSFRQFLNDTEIQYAHKNKSNLTLKDIFIYPDIRKSEFELEKPDVIFSSNLLYERFLETKLYIIRGDEQSGKTTLIKVLFSNLIKNGYCPIYLECGEIKSSNFKNAVSKPLKKQYTDMDFKTYIEKENKILFIDDFHEIRLNKQAQSKLFEQIRGAFKLNHIFITVDSDHKIYDEEYAYLTDFQQIEILPFGHVLRGKLVDKWNSIGVEDTLSDDERHIAHDKICDHIDSVLSKNIVPPRPIYILAMLQTLEALHPDQYQLTSYGQCYQYLILQTLERANVKRTKFDSITNLLTELAYFMFSEDATYLDPTQINRFIEAYDGSYLFNKEENYIQKLVDCNILKNDSGNIQFGYKYIYYFYVAKYLANNINDDTVQQHINNFCEKIHQEKFANILIFITHHTDNQYVFDQMHQHVSGILGSQSEATLRKDEIEFLENFLSDIPQLVIEQRNVDEERHKTLQRKDDIENKMSEPEFENEIEEDTFLIEVVQSIKSVEIIGQVLKNRYGSLKKPRLTKMSNSAFSVGLRSLSLFIKLSDFLKNDITTLISKQISKNTKMDDDKIERVARGQFMYMCYGTIYAVIQKISQSIGAKELIEIFKGIEEEKNTPAVSLIILSILLRSNINFPKQEVEKLLQKFKNDRYAKRLLKELIVQHLYLRYVEYKDMQWISNKLEIPLQTQKLLQGQKSPKVSE